MTPWRGAMIFTKRAGVIFEVRYLEDVSSVRVIQELLSECRVSLSQRSMDDYQCLQCNLHFNPKEGSTLKLLELRKPISILKTLKNGLQISNWEFDMNTTRNILLEVESFHHSKKKTKEPMQLTDTSEFSYFWFSRILADTRFHGIWRFIKNDKERWRRRGRRKGEVTIQFLVLDNLFDRAWMQ